jgi:phosphomannomutase
VSEQEKPDPDFPTVVFPNPEEGQSALDLALQTADREGCTLILANDPDADRLAAAEQGPGYRNHTCIPWILCKLKLLQRRVARVQWQ